MTAGGESDKQEIKICTGHLSDTKYKQSFVFTDNGTVHGRSVRQFSSNKPGGGSDEAGSSRK